MFTGFGNLFSVGGPRKAEATDTRLSLRKHEIDTDAKRKKKQDEAKTQFAAEDDMSVSAKALLVFLENLLKAEEEKKHIHGAFDKANAAQKKKADQQPPSKKPQGEAGYAASVYESRAHFDDRSTQLNNPDIVSAARDMLDIEDIRRIIAMIDDLKYLIARGMNDLHLGKAETFLHSLENAINTAKKNLQTH